MFLFWAVCLCGISVLDCIVRRDLGSPFLCFYLHGMPVAIYSLYIRNIMTGLHKIY